MGIWYFGISDPNLVSIHLTVSEKMMYTGDGRITTVDGHQHHDIKKSFLKTNLKYQSFLKVNFEI